MSKGEFVAIESRMDPGKTAGKFSEMDERQDPRENGGQMHDGELEIVPLVIRGLPPDAQGAGVDRDEEDDDNDESSSTAGHAKEYNEVGRKWKKLVISVTCGVAAVALSIVIIVGLRSRSNTTSSSSVKYRTAFHFQPYRNWMNDPNGMMYYMGYYHLFYQYNPYGPLWGNITWGHAISTDLVHWTYVNNYALVGGPEWYDRWGAWSGSSTILPDGSPALLYTGWSNVSTSAPIQTQNLAVPVDKSDPFLREWSKSPQNPVMVAEPDIDATYYRDPTEGWLGADGFWRTLIGGRTPSGAGTAHLYKSKDFVNWTFSHDLHTVNGTGMWECPDFFPVAKAGREGLQTSVNNAMVKHVLKMSSDMTRHDYYTVGTYDEATDTFQPSNPEIDLGLGLRYDYGKFYASRSFYDGKNNRRLLFGWINESDSSLDAVTSKGWSGIQAIPRQVWLDPGTEMNLMQTPIEEIDELHKDYVFKDNFTLTAGSVMPVDGLHGPQLDIQLEFYEPDAPLSNLQFDGSDRASVSAQNICSDAGAAHRGQFGPFGVLVLAEKELKEQTAVYFHLFIQEDGTWTSTVCSDQSRSSMQDDVDKTVYGTYVHVSKSEEYLTLRTLVDHSVVESFVQGGKSVITSRVYPTMALNDAAHFYLFNNGTQDIQVHSLKAWKMDGAPAQKLRNHSQ